MKEVFVSNYQEEKIGKAKKRLVKVFCIPAVLLLAGLFMGTLWLAIIGLTGFIVCIAICQETFSDIASMRQGMEGEFISRRYLRSLSLPDQYTAYYNIPITYDNGSVQDIDCLIMGPVGLFALEIKHHNGMIFYKNGQWAQVKIGRKGTPYFGGLKNPSGQLMSYVQKLKSIIREETGKSMWINGAIVFTNECAGLEIERIKGVQVVRPQSLYTLFTRSPRLSEADMSAIHSVLKNMVFDHRIAA